MGELVDFVADLDGQLARGHQHERLRRRPLAAVLELFEDRDRKGGGLAGAGAGLAEHVVAGQRAGNDAGLHGRRASYAGPRERREHRVRKAQVAETGFGAGDTGLMLSDGEAVKARKGSGFRVRGSEM